MAEEKFLIGRRHIRAYLQEVLFHTFSPWHDFVGVFVIDLK